MGKVRLAGPLGETGDVLLVVRAASAEQVAKLLEDDPWSHSGLLTTARVVEWHVRHGDVA